MQITSEQLSTAIMMWAENDLMSKSSVLQQGMLTFIILQSKPRLAALLHNLDMLSTDGKFDADELFRNFAKALEKIGGRLRLPIINYDMDADDLRKIRQYVGE